MHWMRENDAPSTLPAIARASTVFAVPGTSSSSTWPPQTSAARTSLISSDLPRTTVSTFGEQPRRDVRRRAHMFRCLHRSSYCGEQVLAVKSRALPLS